MNITRCVCETLKKNELRISHIVYVTFWRIGYISCINRKLIIALACLLTAESYLYRNYVCFAGFQNADSPCCSFWNIRPALTCVPASSLCKDRSKYVFWDEYHPTDSANELIANELIKKFGLSNTNQGGAPSPAPAVAPSPEDRWWFRVLLSNAWIVRQSKYLHVPRPVFQSVIVLYIIACLNNQLYIISCWKITNKLLIFPFILHHTCNPPVKCVILYCLPQIEPLWSFDQVQ